MGMLKGSVHARVNLKLLVSSGKTTLLVLVYYFLSLHFRKLIRLIGLFMKMWGTLRPSN